jgi:hypothetical protein
MAFGTMFGVISALLSQTKLRKLAKLTLTYDVKHAIALAEEVSATSESTGY